MEGDLNKQERSLRLEFLESLSCRLEAGAAQYGNKSFAKNTAQLRNEMEQELLDIAGWAYVMWAKLKTELLQPGKTSNTETDCC